MKKDLSQKFFPFLILLLCGIIGVNAQNILFSEDFSNFTSGNSTDISGSLDTYTTTPGWTGVKVYSYSGKAKMGTSNANTGQGWLQTPALDLSGNGGAFTLEFDATAWNNDSTYIRVYLDNTCYTVTGLDNTNNYDNLDHFILPMTGGTANSHIKFEGAHNGKGRFFIDNLLVSVNGGSSYVTPPTVTIAGNLHSTDTYFSSATVTMSADNGASVYYTLDGNEPSATSTLYTAPFTVTQTTTLKAIAVQNGNSSTVVTRNITILDLNPIFFENFETNGLNQMNVTNVSGTHAWTTTAHSGNTYAYANAYNQGATETWLITPAITPLNAGGVVLNFSSAKNYNGPDIAVKYSTNYSGTGSPASATWTDVTSQCTLSEGSWTWTESGDVVVAGAAPVCFAWVYTSTETSAAGWEIDNIMVLAGNAPVLSPTLTITAPADGSQFSSLDTLPVSVDIQNFTLGTDGYLKVESPLLVAAGLSSPAYLDQNGLAALTQAVFSPLPAGTHTITASLVDMNHDALVPAVNATTTFTVTMPVLNAPTITASGTEAGVANTYYFNAFVSMVAEQGAAIRYTTDGSVPTETSTLYTAPIEITTTTTFKAIAVKANWQSSDVATLEVTITAPTVATPVFTPGTGTYADNVTFSLACATDGAQIRYTIDGSEPTATSTLYSAPITLITTTTVKAKAFKATWLDSETATAVYTVVFDPVLTVDANELTFSSTQLTRTFTVSGAHLTAPIALTSNSTHFTVSPATISNPNSNTEVTVTFDGTEPATGMITVTSDTLSATVALTATAQLPAVVLSPATAVDETLVTVSMNCPVADAAIHYTTDGTDPDAQSATYSTPVIFSTPGTYTVKAIAVKSGWENSDITTGTYTVSEPPAPDTVNVPVITPATDTYYEPQTVTITCADAGAVIRYTLDGSVPTENSTVYSAPFTVNTTTTVTAKAWKTDMIPSETATVTISFPVQVANIAAFKAAAATNEERQIMSDVTFVFRSGRFMYVEDNTAALLIYDYSTPVITTQYNEGEVIEGGIFGKYTTYQGMVEMLPTHNSIAATGTPVTVTPTNTTVTAIKAQYEDVYEAKLVRLNDVEFISATQFVQNGDTMAIYNRFNTVNTTISAGDLADVTGFVSYSTNHGYQIYPRDNNDIVIHPEVVMDTVATPVFNVYRDGEFYRVNLSCATDGATIYYTYDGTDPDETSNEFVTDFPLNMSHYTLKAIAMKEDMVNSAIAVYDYNPSGIADYELRDNLSVYPNPATDRVVIGVRNGDVVIEKVELYNAYGQLLRSVDVSAINAEISVGTLATGTYFAKVFTDKGVATLPVIRK